MMICVAIPALPYWTKAERANAETARKVPAVGRIIR